MEPQPHRVMALIPAATKKMHLLVAPVLVPQHWFLMKDLYESHLKGTVPRKSM
jgi:hypothetical protein